MKKLPLGTDKSGAPVYLPIDIVTEKLAFLGRTGSGKTYSSTKLAELMLDAGAQVIALDPVGVWRGLRMGAAFPVYVFGGLSGDFPLEPTGGALVADILVDRGISAVLDMSQFETQSDLVRFSEAFAVRFFDRKKSSPTAVHLFIEECQEMIPQNCMPGEQKMLRSYERLWKLGRNFGIGGSLISQRPQEINKKALNQASTLFVHQMTGPQERDAIDRWVKDNGLDMDLGGLLPKIKVGSPHVWSPSFLQISEVVNVSPKKSADVSSTPKVGGSAKSQPLTPIDAEKLRTDMAATIERAKANDPDELKKRIRDLERSIAKAPVAALEIKEVKVPDKEKLAEFEIMIRDMAASIRPLIAQFNALDRLHSDFTTAAGMIASALADGRQHNYVRKTEARVASPIARPKPAAASRETNGVVGKCELAILRVLAQHGDGCEIGKLALLSGYRVSGGFRNSLSSLRTIGAIVGDNVGVMQLADGAEKYGPFEPLPHGDELRNYWLTHRSFGKCERAILQALLDRPSQTIEELAKSTGYEVSGGFRNSLSCLRTAGVIVGRNTEAMSPSDDLA